MIEADIASLVVHAYPRAVQRVAARVRRLPGAHVHVVTPDGRLVVTLEADCAEAIASQVGHIQLLPDVLAAALVYQQIEPAAALEEEIHVEGHAPGLR